MVPKVEEEFLYENLIFKIEQEEEKRVRKVQLMINKNIDEVK